MSLKAKVKVGHITNLSEARYCSGMGVDMLGFPVGEDGLKPEQYKQLIEWVTGPEFVLEVHQSLTMDVQYITDNYPGHYIEIGTRQLDWLNDESLNFIVAVKSDEWAAISLELADRKNVKFVEIVDWDGQPIFSPIPILINLQSAGTLSEVLKMNQGVALKGSAEEKPGIMDYSVLAEILEALEE